MMTGPVISDSTDSQTKMMTGPVISDSTDSQNNMMTGPVISVSYKYLLIVKINTYNPDVKICPLRKIFL